MYNSRSRIFWYSVSASFGVFGGKNSNENVGEFPRIMSVMCMAQRLPSFVPRLLVNPPDHIFGLRAGRVFRMKDARRFSGFSKAPAARPDCFTSDYGKA